ncbi:remodeling and spacing factor 1-like [Dreissena polymorpha]|uniref:remodeling and spacing factor 1-like n=1 Tax=Dreissena polymorpha TaxID=45954 RepID=UPI00226466EE|nr:remodeling and spacing factor 1-like [Dreissena polymorpha]
MATESQSVCLSNPNFAVICSFLDKYGEILGLPAVGYSDIENWIEDSKDVHPTLIDIHVKLLRRIHKKYSSVSTERWEKTVIKFCYKYCSVDAWEMEQKGYMSAKVSTKLMLLKNLLEAQFDTNKKFNDKINEMTAEEMRFLPIGRDKHGLAYWFFLDKELNVRVFREDQDDVDSESWELVCNTRDGLARLVSCLQTGTDIKPEVSDFSDSSLKSEPASDSNDDSMDSFKQRTPIGPSPLTIKLELSDSETQIASGESKPPILLKISKPESESPSKLLQNKFKKKKASELKKIICKLKDDEKNMEKDAKNEMANESQADELVEKKENVESDDENSSEKTDNLKAENRKKHVKPVLKSETADNSENTDETKTDEAKTDEVDGGNGLEKDAEGDDYEIVPVKQNVSAVDEPSKSDKGESVDVSKKCVAKEKISKVSESEDKSTVNDVAEPKTSQIKPENPKEETVHEKTVDIKENNFIEGNTVIENKVSDVTVASKKQSTNVKEIKILDPVTQQNIIDTINENKQSEFISETKLNVTVSVPVIDEKVNDRLAEDEKSGAVSVADKILDNKSSDTDKEKSENVSENKGFVSEPESKASSKAVDDKSKKDSLVEIDKESESDCSPSMSCDIQKGHNSDKQIDNCEQNEKKMNKPHLSGEGCDPISENTKFDDDQTVNNDESINESHNCEKIRNDYDKDGSCDIKKSRKRKQAKNITDSESTSEEDDKVVNENMSETKREIKTALRKTAKVENIGNDHLIKADSAIQHDDSHKDEVEEIERKKKINEEDVNTLDSTCNVLDTYKENKSSINEVNEVELDKGTKTKENDSGIKDEATLDIELNKSTKNVENDSGKQDKATVETSIVHNDNNLDVDDATSETKTEVKDERDAEPEEKPVKKLTGLLAHSRQTMKRQAENNADIEIVEPASKRSKLRGRVSSKGRGKRPVATTTDSSSDSDDVPLSSMAGRGVGRSPKGKVVPIGRNSKTPQKSEESPSKSEQNEDSEDMGLRRSARVRTLRARKRSPSPVYLPSESEEHTDDFDDDEFTLKSNTRKRREPKEVDEEVPKGRNALRFEAKTSNKIGKKKCEDVEEEAFPCVKCNLSHQPEWILLCDKCDAGYHTACLRPPLMVIPEGDWFCPPCEHAMLTEKLEEKLKSLDQAIVKNDRMIKRKERLAFVSVSLDNVLKEPKQQRVGRGPAGRSGRARGPIQYSDDESETGTSSTESSGSASESTSESERSEDDRRHKHHSSKPHKTKQRFVQRACRTKKEVSYRFEEFDELIMDAIEEDLSVPKEPRPKKVKPPGISRGKDMSNILGVSDEEEKAKKPPRKRKPRLTELDEEVDDDDTDDYQVSEASDSEATKSSENYESEDVSDQSEISCQRRSTGTRRSTRRNGRSRGIYSRYRGDFVVDSEYESEEEEVDTRRSGRRARRKPVSYRDYDSDETEIENNDDESFHSSDLSDSDFERKRNKKLAKSQKPASAKEKVRSGKRQRIRNVSSSEESSDDSTEEEDATPKKGKKPPNKTARYAESSDSEPVKTKKKNVIDSGEDSMSDKETTESSATEVSEDEVSTAKPKKNAGKPKKKVIESDSGENTEIEEETVKEPKVEAAETAGKDDSKPNVNESHTEESEHDESGAWEEIEVHDDDVKKVVEVVEETLKEVVKEGVKPEETIAEVGDEKVKEQKGTKAKPLKRGKAPKKSSTESKDVEEEVIEQAQPKKAKPLKRGKSPRKSLTESKDEEKIVEKIQPNKVIEHAQLVVVLEKIPENSIVSPTVTTHENMKSEEETTPKKKRGRKTKAEKQKTESETTTPEVTPKKRGRKVKGKADLGDTGQETLGEEPTKKKRGEEGKADVGVKSKKVAKGNNVDEKGNTEESGTAESMGKDGSESNQSVDKVKDDSPLSVRNKQNAPVGVVKPEIRQGVIVENKHLSDGTSSEQRPHDQMNPLQGLREMAMGNQVISGPQPSGFQPYSHANYGSNVPSSMNSQPQGFQPYSNQGAPPPGQYSAMHAGPYQGQPGMPTCSPQAGYPPNHGPMSPNSYQHSGQYMGHVPHSQHGPSSGYYPPGYRSDMASGDGFSGPQGTQLPYQHGPYPHGYHGNQGPYHHSQRGPMFGPGSGPGPNQYPTHPGSGGAMNHPPHPSHPHPGSMGQQFHHLGMQGYNYPPHMHPHGGPYHSSQPPYSGAPNSQPFSPQGMSSPTQPLRPTTRLATPALLHGSGTSPRPEGPMETPNRGFMMDNILKSSQDSNEVEDSAEVSDIDRYTSFLCKDK